jgi:hypothetical protein
VWGGEAGWDLAGIVAAITSVVPVADNNPAGAVIKPAGDITKGGVVAFNRRVVMPSGALETREALMEPDEVDSSS